MPCERQPGTRVARSSWRPVSTGTQPDLGSADQTKIQVDCWNSTFHRGGACLSTRIDLDKFTASGSNREAKHRSFATMSPTTLLRKSLANVRSEAAIIIGRMLPFWPVRALQPSPASEILRPDWAEWGKVGG